MKVIEYISYFCLATGACAIPGAIEFSSYLAPAVLLVLGGLLKLLTTFYYYE